MPWPWILASNGLFLLLSFIDLFLSPKRKDLTFGREIHDEMERGISYKGKVSIQNQSDKHCSVTIIDSLPPSFDKPDVLKGDVKPRTKVNIKYQTVANRRGDYQLDYLYVRFTSFLGLWEKQMTVPIEDEIKVIPDLTETKNYLQNAQLFLLYEGDKIRKQRSGTGEFARIRNYVVGDDPRKINWRQTAKLQEVMTNEYEPEHGKYITILIDCGRMMGAELKKGNRLEKALEAAIAVTAAALKNGDYVGVLAFSKEVKVYVPPAKGMDHLQKVLQAIYHLEVDPYESNYPAVMSYLETYQKKRSLLMLFSDVHTFLHEESALFYFRRLRRRHLFFMIGIEGEELLAATRQSVHSIKMTMIKSIAQQQVQFKKREKAKWERQGLLMIEAKEEKLATTAISHYISMINEGML